MERSGQIWKTVAPGLICLAIVLSLFGLWQIAGVPSEVELIPVARAYFAQYGLATVFVGALFEGLLLIGIYLPGTFVILLGVILAGGDPARLAAIWSVVVAGLLCAYTIDYALGRFGWYRLLIAYGLQESLEKARRRIAARGATAIFTSFWQINIAAVTATAAGILQFSFARFLACAACAAGLWMAFWMTLITSLGASALALVNLRFIMVALILWVSWLGFTAWRQARREKMDLSARKN